MAISFESIGQKLVSFKASAALKAGDPCILCANDTVMPTNEGGEFCGIASGVRGGVAGVIVGGCVTVPYDDAVRCFCRSVTVSYTQWLCTEEE